MRRAIVMSAFMADVILVHVSADEVDLPECAFSRLMHDFIHMDLYTIVMAG
jgi:hypothetical protein